MSSDETAAAGEFSPELRLHPVSWVFAAISQVKSLIVPLLAAMVTGLTGDFTLWVSAAVIVPLIGVALWRQRIYRYGFAPHGLVIHEGLFFRNVRTIDYARIENVDTSRGLLHRLLGVAEVLVETSTGGSAEARIRVLDLASVEAMRVRIFAHTPGEAGEDGTALDTEAAPAVEAETLLALRPAELVRYGLIDNRGMLVVAGLFGVLAQAGFFENMQEWSAPLVELLPWENLAGLGLAVQIVLGLALAGALVAGTRVLSILLAFVVLYDFRLTRSADDLQTRRGLLTRVAMTLRRRRIQAVHQTASLLHRVFDRVSLKVDLAGGPAGGGEGQHQGAQQHFQDRWLAPLVPTGDAGRLIAAALPQVRLQDLVWRSLSPRARWRIFRMLATIWLLAAGAPAIWWAGWWAVPLLAAPLPLLWLHAALHVRFTGWALHEDLFALRRGWLTRRLALTPRSRMQSVHVHESPFDRHHRMAQVTLDIAGVSSAGHHFTIPYLERSDAERLAAELGERRLAG